MREYLGFGDAFKLAEEGYKIGNQDWDSESYIRACKPQKYAFLSNNYLYIYEPVVGFSAWTPRQKDLFSNYYYVIEYCTEESY